MNPQKLDKWRRWIGHNPSDDATLYKELIDLMQKRRVFVGVQEMIEENPEIQKHSLFYGVWGETYADSVLMYLRRLIKKRNPRNRREVTLIDLLEDLRDNAEMVTRDWYVDEHFEESGNAKLDKHRRSSAESTFDRHFAGDCGLHLDPDVASQDIQRLEEILAQCEELIDQRIAHLETKEPTSIPTFSQLDQWILEIRDTFWKYNLLIWGRDTKMRVGLSHDWRAIFRVAWIHE